MDSIQRLLAHVRCKQLLLCAYRPEEAPSARTPSLTEVMTALRIGSAECLHLAERLRSKGLIEPVEGGEPGRFRLTPRGVRLVHRMARAALHPVAPAP